jgi:hypothetical protein
MRRIAIAIIATRATRKIRVIRLKLTSEIP